MLKKLFSLIIVALILGGAFIGFRMATVPTELTVNQTITTPQLIDLPAILKSQPDISKTSLNYAVAIDGQLVYTNEQSSTASNQTVQPIASTAKIILALMIMEKKPFPLGEQGETITITPELNSIYEKYNASDGSTVPVQINEQISQYDALSGVLIASANNLADSLAIWAFGSLSEYQKYASDKLKEWGIEHVTIGSDASGFSPDTTGTAADMAILGQKLMENPVLSEIVSRTVYTIPVAGQIDNTNKLLGVDDIVGVKTGYIGDASGYCLVSAYRLGDHIVTFAVLGAATRAESFAYTQNLVETVQSHLLEITIATAGAEVGNYDSWWTGKIPITVQEDVRLLNWQPSTPEISLDTSSGTLSVKTIPSGTKTHPDAANAQTYPISNPDFPRQPDLKQRLERALQF